MSAKDDPSELSRISFSDLLPADFLLLARSPCPRFLKELLDLASQKADSIRPLQLATLAGIKRNSHLAEVCVSNPNSTSLSACYGDARKSVISCPIELALVKKVHRATRNDAILVNQLLVTLTHAGNFTTLLVATLRNAYLKGVLEVSD